MLFLIMGRIRRQQGDLDAAFDNARKGLELADEQGNQHMIASFHHLFGVLYHRKMDPEMAMEHYNKCLSIRERSGNRQLIPWI